MSECLIFSCGIRYDYNMFSTATFDLELATKNVVKYKKYLFCPYLLPYNIEILWLWDKQPLEHQLSNLV